jgi:hypothetical protein
MTARFARLDHRAAAGTLPLLALPLVLALGPSVAWAQQGSVQDIVTDSVSAQPIELGPGLPGEDYTVADISVPGGC